MPAEPSADVPGHPGSGSDHPSEGSGVNLKRVLTWLAIAFVVFYLIKAPESSANIVRNAGEALGNAASSLAAFVNQLS